MEITNKKGKKFSVNENIAILKTQELCNVIIESQAEILSIIKKTSYDKEYKLLVKKYKDKISVFTKAIEG